MILLVNQHVVPIFTDIANAFSGSHDVTLFVGHVEKGGEPISPDIKVVKSFRYRRKSSFTRLITWLVFSTHYFLYLVFCRKPDRILVVTNPPVALMVTLVVARLRRIPFYVLVYDLYPDALFQAGFTTSRNPIFRIWQRINPAIFKRSRKIFTLSESMKRAVERYVSDSSKIRVISNWADNSYIAPLKKNENPFVKSNGLEGKKVVMYSGNMGLTHDLESLLEAAYRLREDASICFLIVGEGGKKKKLEEFKNLKKLDNVIFLPYQDESNFPFAMAAADIGVVTLGIGAEGISVPSKTYMCMAAGQCLLTISPEDSELTRLVTKYEVGVNCEPGQPAKIADQIRHLFSSNDILNRYQLKAREVSFQFTPANALHYVKEVME